MALLTDAKSLYVGASPAQKVYMGTEPVWPGGLTDLDTIPNLVLWIDADDNPTGVLGATIPARKGPTMTAEYDQRGIPLSVVDRGTYRTFNFTGWQWLQGQLASWGPDFTFLSAIEAVAQPNQYATLIDCTHSSGGWVSMQNSQAGSGQQMAYKNGPFYQTNPAIEYRGHLSLVQGWKQGGSTTFDIDVEHASAGGGPPGMDLRAGWMRIGAYLGGGRWFTGQVASFAIWDRALDPAEIAEARGYFTQKYPLPEEV